MADGAEAHLRAHMADLLEGDCQQRTDADLIELDERVVAEHVLMQVARDDLAGNCHPT